MSEHAAPTGALLVPRADVISVRVEVGTDGWADDDPRRRYLIDWCSEMRDRPGPRETGDLDPDCPAGPEADRPRRMPAGVETMSYADYAHCPGCDGKALYLGDSDVPEGVEAWHSGCLKERIASAAAPVADVRARDSLLLLAAHLLRVAATLRDSPDVAGAWRDAAAAAREQADILPVLACTVCDWRAVTLNEAYPGDGKCPRCGEPISSGKRK